MNYLLTQDALNVEIDGKPYSVSSTHPDFAKVRDAVLNGAAPFTVLQIMTRRADTVLTHVRTSLAKQSLSGLLTYDSGMIYYDGRPIMNYAVECLLKFLSMGHDATALIRFIEKQQQNPDPVVHEHLYKFMEVGDIPLTEDGDFLVYKAVRADYRDIHSGRFDNRVGASPRVPREAVDPDRQQTCSRGLHVCSYAYLPHFSHANGHVMMCKVNPADVVAIPEDYNNTKMRVCAYEVVGEVTEYYKQGVDILSEEQLMSRKFEVWVESDVTDEIMVYDAFFTRREAELCLEAIASGAEEGTREMQPTRVWLETTDSDEVLLEKTLGA